MPEANPEARNLFRECKSTNKTKPSKYTGRTGKPAGKALIQHVTKLVTMRVLATGSCWGQLTAAEKIHKLQLFHEGTSL